MREACVRGIERAAIAFFGLLTLGIVWQLGLHLLHPFVLLPAAILGYLAADLTSGLVHWFCDSFFEEDSPLIGELLIHPFREHHRDPLGMTRHTFAELNGNSCLAMLPTMALTVLLTPRAAPWLAACLMFFHLSLFATNVFHRWAHSTAVSAPVRWLQNHCLILPPAEHGIHHRRGRSAYCITSGWMNRPLDLVLGSDGR